MEWFLKIGNTRSPTHNQMEWKTSAPGFCSPLARTIVAQVRLNYHRNFCRARPVSAYLRILSAFVLLAAIQWFGIDIGGTLAKCVYFETPSSNNELEGKETQGVTAMRNFLKSTVTYGSTGIRDARLEMGETIGGQKGTLHFIKFATSRMDGFFRMVTTNGLASFPKVVCATGGGAFKFEEDFKKVCITLASGKT